MGSAGTGGRSRPGALLLAFLVQTWPPLRAAAAPGNGSDPAPTAAPEAEGPGAGPSKKRAHCKPKEDRHGVWNGSTEPGGEYVLTCDPGYSVDDAQTVTLTCSEDEVQWNANPWCENIDDCARLEYSCGPAGVCHDHVGYSECLCERGAAQRHMRNGETYCYFLNESKHCGGRNCGSHGICVDLTQYQQSFDTGDNSFRCSCELGFKDDGRRCSPVDCGKRHDPMGTWSGSSAFQGQYTLECEDGAFVLGGKAKAITVSCPADGRWESEPIFNSTPPKCVSPTQVEHDANVATLRVWVNLVMALMCICGAALAAGLTMGLVSLEPREMEIIQRARLDDCLNEEERERLLKQKEAAQHILPLIKDHHLLLVTLLLLNALANEALPIFLDELVSPLFAVLLSVSFVLVCGEILPSAVFTGPLQLTIAAFFIPCVRFLLCGLYVIAKPIAIALDKGLPHKSAEEELYSRPAIRAVLSLHSQGEANQVEAISTVPSSRRRLLDGEPSSDLEDPPPEEPDPPAPLDPLEVRLCFGILDAGEVLVERSHAFQSQRRCYSAYHAVAQSTLAWTAAGCAAAVEAEAVVVFKSLDLVNWPIEVPLEELVGVLRLPELLSAPATATVADLCTGQAVVDANDSVANALCALADACGTPCAFAVVIERCEFKGLLDGEAALEGLMAAPEAPGPLAPSPKALPREAAQAVKDALATREVAAPKQRIESLTLSPVQEQASPNDAPWRTAKTPSYQGGPESLWESSQLLSRAVSSPVVPARAPVVLETRSNRFGLPDLNEEVTPMTDRAAAVMPATAALVLPVAGAATVEEEAGATVDTTADVAVSVTALAGEAGTAAGTAASPVTGSDALREEHCAAGAPTAAPAPSAAALGGEAGAASNGVPAPAPGTAAVGREAGAAAGAEGQTPEAAAGQPGAVGAAGGGTASASSGADPTPEVAAVGAPGLTSDEPLGSTPKPVADADAGPQGAAEPREVEMQAMGSHAKSGQGI